MSKYIEPDHIGTILKEEFMESNGLSMNALANAIGVPANRIHGIVHGLRGITADTDLRLTLFFGLSQGFFLRIQNRIDMTIARQELDEQIATIIPIKSNSQFHPSASTI
ncbi:MAG: HigA family addiction module antidote protein [Rickettsiales bacterium]|jgi:addiction module HigA family antidote|nr:HigA family addiction module antidote protein [Rickettsiales bacterium]